MSAFSQMSDDPRSWTVVTDQVMGGKSELEANYDEGTFQLKGFVTTKNNGGFVRLTEEGILFSSKGHITKISTQELVKYIYQSSASISTGPISIKPLKTRPGRPKKGTIIFNEVSEKFEGYDGTEWRTIKWED